MIVRLTRHQAAQLRAWLGAIDDARAARALAWLEAEPGQIASKHRVDLAMPTAGWHLVERWLFDHCYDQRGWRAKHASDVQRRAQSAIRRSLNARSTHPALSRLGAVGLVSELIPAWRLPAPDASGKAFSPLPVPNCDFVVLGPVRIVKSGVRATKWAEIPLEPLGQPMFDEAEHWAFYA